MQALDQLAGDRLFALKRQAYLLCGDNDQAEDLVQDALVRAFARPTRAVRPEAAEAYVRKVMMHLFIDQQRKRSRWSHAAPVLAPPNAVPDPADEIVIRAAMTAALSALSQRQRACVVLRYYEDLSVPQIAGNLGLQEGTVKRYLSEAIERLAGHLASPDGETRGH